MSAETKNGDGNSEKRGRTSKTAVADTDIEYQFYEKFFFEKGLEPYPVQEQAFGKIVAGESVMVTVPTGTGKTMIAKSALYAALNTGKRAVYTTPLRALTEEKFRELTADFGEENVGFITGDYSFQPNANIVVAVAEIVWNQVYGAQGNDDFEFSVVVMDEGHYFNDFDRGYVWEQTIIGLPPRVQLCILSATVGRADLFCDWCEDVRGVPMALVESFDRRIPLLHEYREEYLIEVVRDLAHKGEVPAVVFVFGREKCFEVARLLKSCRRFTTDEEREEIRSRADAVLLDGGIAPTLKGLLAHGIGIHHAGILPKYKQLVEELTLERLLKVVVCTETIAAGINLPAKRVVFPSIRKYIKRKARLLTPAEFHQMSGRAGRPQFDSEGVAITLAPEDVVQEFRKEVKAAKKRGKNVDEGQILRATYSRAQAAAAQKDDVTYDRVAHQNLVKGQPAELRSKTKINPEQILAIGLPDLKVAVLGEEREILASGTAASSKSDESGASPKLDIARVVDKLLLSDRDKREAHKRLAQVTANMKALGVVDEEGQQISGEIIRSLQGMDSLFVYSVFKGLDPDPDQAAEMAEFLVNNDSVQRILDRKDIEKKRAWIKERLSERRRDNPQVSWEDVEEEFDEKFPRSVTFMEELHGDFTALLPHPELHGGKRPKAVWAAIADGEMEFLEFVNKHGLSKEEGSLFGYLIRVMKVAKKIAEATSSPSFASLESEIREYLGKVDARILKEAKS